MLDQNLFSFFMHASFIVKCVMLLLIAMSIASWAVIFQRGFLLKNARKAADAFEDRFWSGVNLNDLYTQCAQAKVGGLQKIFVEGFKEFKRLQSQAGIEATDTLLEATQRTMRVARSHEVDSLQQHLSFLATAGSISPYVGLFGTVVGIMTALHALGNVTQASISMVAPGIGEALIATAMGLFVAIPAYVAYNRYVYDSERLANQYQIFQEEFSNILYRFSRQRDVTNA